MTALSAQTAQGLQAIKRAFQNRYPNHLYPTLNAALDRVLDRNAEALNADPNRLAQEVAFFRCKYAHGIEPATIQDEGVQS